MAPFVWSVTVDDSVAPCDDVSIPLTQSSRRYFYVKGHGIYVVDVVVSASLGENRQVTASLHDVGVDHLRFLCEWGAVMVELCFLHVVARSHISCEAS